MFQKILVAVDTSKSSKQVFDTALSLAKANNASLLLLHVVSEEELGSPTPILPSLEYYPSVYEKNMELYQQQREAFTKQGLDMLRSRHQEAMAAGVNVEFRQLSGSPGRLICDFALAWKADLIVTGRRGRRGLSEFFMGSVSNYVLHHAPCSVLTVQSPVQPAEKLQSAEREVSVGSKSSN
ncbi:universal stress protein [Scytonema millei]|uniref:Universal stress protein n=1 Tax=Scytonema millei VB511283 TaxID=1245923 RepID=A0A9X5E8P7_9CYAN|nr:universal stress protein [Scytonema millei]NHC36966.1 universal stress protein [Scytonema millei VB511283]